MHGTRYRGIIVVLLAIAVVVAGVPGVPVAGRATAASGATTSRTLLKDAAQQAGIVARQLAPLAVSADVTATATTTPTVVATSAATPTITATATTAPTMTATPRPTRKPTPRPTKTPTPRPTHTHTPTATSTPTPPPTNTPLPTATATPLPPSVRLLSVGVYKVVKGHERRITLGELSSTVRLKIVVIVANVPAGGVRVSATWALRGSVGGKTYYRDSRDFQLRNGATGLFYDLVLPVRNFATGAYYFVGSITYRGAVQQKVTMLHVIGQKVVLVQMRVHYAHLRLTVPANWHLDFSTDSNGRPVTGKDSLLMLSNTGLALVDVISVHLDTTPSSADLQAFPAQLLQQEFSSGVSNVRTIFFKGQIDGHDVFAAQGDVTISGRLSQAIAIVTNKSRQFYSFTVVNYFKRASPGEQHAAFAAIFGSKLD